jgi:hypothetical protein
MSLNILIQTIGHGAHRAGIGDTVGDWVWTDEHNLLIRVSDLGDWRYQALVAVHELVEALLCREHGISTETVDAWDNAYDGDGEPGDDQRCPYRNEHRSATTIEMLLAHELDVQWQTYEEAINRAGED